ncbi:MAG TPA: hypothetical protein VMT55_03010, partial [Candidatus Sulfotelmatobacter sp.]|nr:hypothetical protein [Candidatus Sulfotelmatobacter sp.]
AGPAEVDFSGLWAGLRDLLDDQKSFGKNLSDNTYPTDPAGQLAFLLGLVETKRRWALGLKALGLDPYSPNADGAVDRFNAAFNSISLQEAGAINIQVLQNYTSIMQAVAAKFNALADDPTLNDVIIPGALADYNGSAADAQKLIDELKQPLSTDDLAPELKTAISGAFSQALTKPLAAVIGVMGMNSTFRGINKTNQKKYEQQKDDAQELDKEEMKAEGKHQARVKAEEKEAEKRDAERAQANRQADRQAANRPTAPRAKKGG